MTDTKHTILFAEDEPALRQIIKESLESKGFEVIFCKNGEIAYQKYKSLEPELLVLDVMMPLKDGFTLAKEIRRENEHIPIIFLTAKSQTKDVVDGFELGGNDYLKKPFSIEELIVRINALLKRNKSKDQLNDILLGLYTFDYNKQTLTIKDDVTSLTHREAELLFHLYNHKNDVLDRTFVLNKLWGNDDFFNARSMDVFISKLRKKLNQDESIQIVNVRGYGYKLIC
ncbi:MAG: response regulator transcription factor [Flavobacteriaceae bacterium]|nr:response regulator transcription factor [Flavobacteriaceae bacterium]